MSDNGIDQGRKSIKKFYENSSILITGATGFMGKCLIEKLLRSCESIKCIYILMRSKKTISPENRFKLLIQSEVSIFIVNNCFCFSF